MNDQEFILLMEEYLDGTLSAAQRTALRDEVAADPERRRLFEAQARQHVRLHAQTSRVDFADSQRIAIMAMEVVGKTHDPSTFASILHDQTLRERFAAIRDGFRAPKGSGPHRYARFALLRLFGPPALSVTASVVIVLLLVFVWVPHVTHPISEDDYIITDITLGPDRLPPVLDPKPKTPPPATSQESPSVAFRSIVEIPDEPPAHPVPRPTPPTERSGPTPGSKRALPAFVLPSAFEGRNPAHRYAILRHTEGADQTERAVTNALNWLRDHQLENGSWAGQEPVAMTGLALLAYLAHGEVPGSGVYGDSVTRGLQFLLAAQDKAGFFSHNVYAHAIATYAVSEACTLTRIVELRTSMAKAVQIIIQGQQDAGGFDYHYDKNIRFDTSVSGWQIQALRAASLAGPGQPSMDTALVKSIRFLQTQAFARDGSGFVYEGSNLAPTTGGGKWTMTGVGTLCLQLLGKPDAPQVRLGLKTLRDVTFDWIPDAKPSLYGYYYLTQAYFHQDNKAVWQKWNVQMQKAILKNQRPDGHWENGDYDQGSHVYTTTLCTLMLEVYYRYLPTFEKVPEKIIQAKAPEGDVTVNVQ